MAGSGVMRLRAAKKGGGPLSIQHVSQKTAGNDVSRRSVERSHPTKAPSATAVWADFPVTKNAIGNESPHRGEHPNSGRKSD